jgi:hypothetical protein
MSEPIWPDELDAIVRRAAVAGEGTWWDEVAAVIRGGLPTETQAQLATIGLAELVSWATKLDADPGFPCAGHHAARRRWPDLVAPATPSQPHSRSHLLLDVGGQLLDEA